MTLQSNPEYGLQYNNIPKEAIRISPSSISKFTTRKWEWFQEVVNKESLFLGNDSTILGTCVHKVAEDYIKLRKVNKESIYAYIDTFKDRTDINKEFIKEQFVPMGQSLINYLNTFGIPKQSELTLTYKFTDDIYLAGTIDAIQDNTVIDFKTTSNLSPLNDIPQHYKWQLLTYAWLAKKEGFTIDKIKILWITQNHVNRISDKTGKKMKDYPSIVKGVTHLITDEDMRFIDDYINLIVDTLKFSNSNPQYNYITYSDYRLKEKYSIGGNNE